MIALFIAPVLVPNATGDRSFRVWCPGGGCFERKTAGLLRSGLRTTSLFLHMKSVVLLGILAGTLLVSPLPAQEFKAGVGRSDITPEGPIWLAGYAGRDRPSEGVDQHIFVKALALQDPAGAATLILTADTIGTPRWFNDALAERIEKELKVPRERFLFACSHSHTTPVVHGCLKDMYGLEGQTAAVVENYSKTFLQKSFEAAQSALNSLEPAKLSYAKSECFIMGNRRQFGPKGPPGFGINPNGLVDHEVPVLRVDHPDGTLKAVVFGCACHNTTPGQAYQISGDWAGYAQADLEQTYAGSTALFITGCGADANPNPRGNMTLARAHGLELAGAVARALSEQGRPVKGDIRASFDRASLPLEKTPAASYYEAKATEKPAATQRYARRLLGLLAKGDPLMTQYDAPVQVLRFGDTFTLVAMSGEVVVDYAYRLRREMPDERVWAAGYCNDVFAYVPSMRILTEGGYEADSSLIYYGFPTRFAPAVEDTLVGKVLELSRKVGANVPEPPKKK